MNWSKYNYLYNSEKHGFLLYNSLSGAFISLDEQDYDLFKKVQKSIVDEQELFNIYDSDELINAKILVENDLDELNKLKYSKHSARYNTNFLGLTIAPTLHCNLNCSYCFEASRPPIYMDETTIQSILNFVKMKSSVDTVGITWYGGEPLLAFDKIITLTKEIENLNKKVTAGIITNGILLTEEKIKLLKKLHISEVQVTLDGPKQINDKRRVLIEGGSSFDKIVSNIDKLFSIDKENKIRLLLRVNIDKSNENNYHEIFTFLNNRYKGKNIYVHPGFVTEANESCVSNSEIILKREEMAKFLFSQYENHEIIHGGFLPVLKKSECSARIQNNFIIGPTGNVYKCWSNIGDKSKIIFNLNDPSIINNSVHLRYLTGADPFDNKKCRNCFYLPICGGGCPHEALKKIYENKKVDICAVEKGSIEDFLDYHYSIKKQELSS